MRDLDALDASADLVVGLVRKVGSEDWHRATPCTEWNVRELVGHLSAGMIGYARLLRGGTAADFHACAEQGAVLGGEDAGAVLREAADQVRAEFTEPGALGRVVHHPLGDLPGAQLLLMRILDNVVHSWDLASALDVPVAIDEGLAQHCYVALLPLADVLPATGVFQPPQRTPDEHAAVQEKLLALVGR